MELDKNITVTFPRFCNCMDKVLDVGIAVYTQTKKFVIICEKCGASLSAMPKLVMKE